LLNSLIIFNLIYSTFNMFSEYNSVLIFK
jgi:hypothetical protein